MTWQGPPHLCCCCCCLLRPAAGKLESSIGKIHRSSQVGDRRKSTLFLLGKAMKFRIRNPSTALPYESGIQNTPAPPVIRRWIQTRIQALAIKWAHTVLKHLDVPPAGKWLYKAVQRILRNRCQKISKISNIHATETWPKPLGNSIALWNGSTWYDSCDLQ